MNIQDMNNLMLRAWARDNDIPTTIEYRCADCRELLSKVSDGVYTCKNDWCDSYLEKFEVKEND